MLYYCFSTIIINKKGFHMKRLSILGLFLFVLLFSYAKADNTWESIYSERPDIQNCKAGALTQSEKTILLNKINQIRKIHKLSQLTWESAGDDEAMQASLICAANGILDHEPASSNECYTQVGFNGAKTSNLHIGFNSAEVLENSEDAVVGWLIDDKSASGDELGHRRAVINPFLEKVSFGRVDGFPKSGDFTEWFATAMSMKYQDYVVNTSTKVSVDYVAMPYEYYPVDFFKKDFYLSFSAIPNKTSLWANESVDFSSVVITMKTEAGASVTISNQKYDNEGWGSLPNNLQWKAAGLQNDVKYLVTIKNVKYNGQALDYSYWFKLTNDIPEETLDTPTLATPENASTDLTVPVELTWNTVNNAETYNLTIAKDQALSNIVKTLTDISTTDYNFEDAEKGTTYYWTVQAKNSNTLSQWSQIRNFTTKAVETLADPAIVYPGHNQGDIRPDGKLIWSKVNGANVKYQVQISESMNFDGTLVLNKNKITDTTYLLSNLTLLEKKAYSWRVRAYNDDYATNWSAVKTFITYDPAGIDDELNSCISISPNPVTANSLSVRFNVKLLSITNIKIYDVSGEILFDLDYDAVSSNSDITINLKDFSNGIYLIKIESAGAIYKKAFSVIK